MGCRMATAPPALRHRTRLLAAWAVADLFMLRSVRRVPQSYKLSVACRFKKEKSWKLGARTHGKCGGSRRSRQELHDEHDRDVLATSKGASLAETSPVLVLNRPALPIET